MPGPHPYSLLNRPTRYLRPVRNAERWSLPLLALAGLVLFTLHLVLGPVPIPWSSVKAVLLGHDSDPGHALIVGQLRLPRAITAAAAGAGLAASALMMPKP